MVEVLEHLIRQAYDCPRRSRLPLYEELLRSEIFLLSLDAPLKSQQMMRVVKADESFPIWVDKDQEMGGIWVPVFAARDAVSGYVKTKDLRPPAGKEFLWMGHKAGILFSLLLGIKCFAGMRLYLDENASVALSWSEVKALSQGKLPSDKPETYDIPLATLILPAGARIVFGRVGLGSGGGLGRLLCLPQTGHFRSDDLRKLVRLSLPEGPAWMACRHFLQVLRSIHSQDGDQQNYAEELLCSLVGFEMYGEAEALCEWLSQNGRQAYGWAGLAVIYLKTGQLGECAELCRRGINKYPDEKIFPLKGAEALSLLNSGSQARQILKEALGRFPKNARILKCLKELERSGSLTGPILD